MKEVTYEDWQKNPTPRMMWVWDSNIEDKEKRMVLFITEMNISHPVIALTSARITTVNYKHCAEIEEPKTRLMTHKELSRWLREKPTREFKYRSSISCSVYSTYIYDEDEASKEVPDGFLIRENDSDWREPLVEVADEY